MGKALVLCAFALTLVGGPSAAFYSRGSGSAEYTKLGQNNLTFTTINCPDAVGGTIPQDINNGGQIVGGYVDSDGTLHGFLRNNGVCTPINHREAGTGPGLGTVALGINDLGQIVGIYITRENSENIIRGFLRVGDIFQPIDYPDAIQTNPFGINNQGQIVGNYFDSAGKVQGFFLVNEIYTRINVPGALQTSILSINDLGHVVGAYANVGTPFENGPLHGFVLNGFPEIKFDHPDADPNTVAYGINNCGQIVGRYTDEGIEHGYLRENGLFTTIDDQEFPLGTIAYDINDLGQIIGYSLDREGVHGFLTSVESPCRNGQ
jgi:probable HAF family extracellular repeat protein